MSFGPDRGEAPALSHCPQCKLGGFGRFFYDVYDPPEGHPVYNRPVSFQANNSYVSYWSDLLDRPAGEYELLFVPMLSMFISKFIDEADVLYSC